MTNDNEETRSYTEIAAENERLEKELRDAKVNLGLAVIVNTDLQKEKLARLDDDYLVIDNRDLHKQLAQARATIADYERADAVAEAMAANNDVLGKVSDDNQ